MAAGAVDTLGELETDRSCLGTRPGIVASTCKAFNFSLYNPRVRWRCGSGPGRPSNMPRECTWMLAKEEACSEEGRGIPEIHFLGATTFDHLPDSEEVVWTFFRRVGDCTRLLWVTVESMSSGDKGTRDWTGNQGAAAATARNRHPRELSCKSFRLATLRMEYWMAGLWSSTADPFQIQPPGHCFILLHIQYEWRTNICGWSQHNEKDGAYRPWRTYPYPSDIWRVRGGLGKSKAETMSQHRGIDYKIDLEPSYNLPYWWISIEWSWVEQNWVECREAVVLQLHGPRSCAHKAGSWIGT